MNLILDLGILFIITGVIAVIFKLFDQPLIPAYVISGILIKYLGIIKNEAFFSTFSELGIAFMLFFIGLEIDIKSINNVFKISTFGTSMQFILTLLISLLFLNFLPYPLITKLYLGIALSFSSTAIVVKILSDRKEIDTLHGRIAIGILLFQDIIAILVLALLNPQLTILEILIKLNIALLIALIVGYKLIPYIFEINAKSQELLFITTLSYTFFYILVFWWFDLSITIGAFIAGLTLGNLKYSHEITAMMRSLKDFFSVIFFISLGFMISYTIKINWTILLGLLFLTIIIKPIIFFFLGLFFNYEPNVSFKVAIYLSQLSEFSLILVTLIHNQGFIGKEMMTYVILITLLTMILTNYLVKVEPHLFKKLKLDKRFKIKSKVYNVQKSPELLISGFNRLGYNLFEELKNNFKEYLIIDYNPEIIEKLNQEGHYCVYGDASDPELLKSLNLKSIKLAISTLHELNQNISFLKTIKSINKNTKVIVTAYDIDDAIKLYNAGADYVILPHFISGQYIGLMFKELNNENFEVLKFNHFKELLRKKKWFESKGLHKILKLNH